MDRGVVEGKRRKRGADESWGFDDGMMMMKI